jgi:hypothetical protein
MRLVLKDDVPFATVTVAFHARAGALIDMCEMEIAFRPQA